MFENLKVGDKVRIKKDLKYGATDTEQYGRVIVTRSMLKYVGQVATIHGERNSGVYVIDLDNREWAWHGYMFEDVIVNKIPKLEAGMIVHCDTEEKAKIFLDECKKQGFYDKFYDKGTYWNEYREKMCYRICGKENGVLYGLIDGTYRNETVIEFDDLFKEEEVIPPSKYIEKAFKELSKSLELNFRKLTHEIVYEKPLFIDDNVSKVIRNSDCVIVILDTGEKGVAKCSPHDEFDLEVGYSIAHSRALVEKHKNDIAEEMKNIKYLIELEG